jgi:hypothetical protein
MDAAIEAMEREEGGEIGYVGIAKKYGVDESTLHPNGLLEWTAF